MTLLIRCRDVLPAQSSNCGGKTIHVPRSTNFQIEHTSPRIGKYCLNSMRCHCWLTRLCHTEQSSGSFFDAFTISRVVIAVGEGSATKSNIIVYNIIPRNVILHKMWKRVCYVLRSRIIPNFKFVWLYTYHLTFYSSADLCLR